MEQELDDGMFWLPADFLDDEDDFKSGKPNSGTPAVNKIKPNLNLFGFYGTNCSSLEPVTVTETDEEGYLNELSRNLAQFTLEDDFWTTETKFNHSKSARVMSGSPKSTLCGWNQISSRGSSNCPSPVPTPPLSNNESPWDVLSAAAGEVARMRMTGEAGFKHRDGNGNRVSPPPPSRRIPSPNPQFRPIQPAQVKQQNTGVFLPRWNGGGNMKPVAPSSLSAWPTLQQAQQLNQPRGTRAVLVENPNTKRAGTGVFLPRQIGAPTEPRKNQGAKMRYRDSVLMTEQKRQPAEKGLRLPQEWTY